MSRDTRRPPEADEAASRLADAFRESLSAADLEAPPFEEVAAYVDGRLLGEERLLFEERLAGDPLLRAEVQDLRELREEMAQRRAAPSTWIGWAAAAAVVAALGAGLLSTRGREKPGPQVAQAPAPAAPAVAEMKDGPGPIALRADGSIAGLDVPPGLAPALADAMRNGQFRVAALRSDLAVGRVTPMGPTGATAPFGPVSPLSTLVRSDRPTLRFTAHPKASGYVVSIYDLDLERVASSPTLHATEWTPERPLPRGRTYVWQIEARTPAGRVAAPAPPEAEARFHVASAETAARVEAAVGSGSHLAAGVALAEAGFVEEAEQQFGQLVALNPGSAEARKLLDLSRASRPRR
jgi:hypothetical protein